MKAVGIVLAVVLVGTGILFSQLNANIKDKREEFFGVFSQHNEELLPTQTEEPWPTESPKEVPSTATAFPTPTKAVMKGSISDYRYPNSETFSSFENALSLKSFDDPKIVTNWYKEKIIEEGMNVKTFVETKTNDNVLNELVGTDDKKEIRVEVKKEAGSSFVQIEVSLKTTS